MTVNVLMVALPSQISNMSLFQYSVAFASALLNLLFGFVPYCRIYRQTHLCMPIFLYISAICIDNLLLPQFVCLYRPKLCKPDSCML